MIGRRASYTIALLSTLSNLCAVFAQSKTRTLPPTVCEPRSREEWSAKRAAQAGWEGDFPDEFPEAADAFSHLLDRTRAITAQYFGDDVVLNSLRADELVSELYVDVGDPRLNPYFQDLVIAQIGIAARDWPEERLPSDARRSLLDGLMTYYEAGGGRYWPANESQLARTLSDLDRTGDQRVGDAVADLLWDAFDWAQAVDSDLEERIVGRECVRAWGDEFWFDAYDARLSADALPKALPERYGRVVEMLRALIARSSADDKRFGKLVKDATELTLTPFDDERLNNDVRSRLLIVYRRLLERRPVIPERVSDYVERQLLKLASRRSGLTTDQHWELWEKAVNAIGPRRISHTTLSFIERESLKETQPTARRTAMMNLMFLKERRAALDGD